MTKTNISYENGIAYIKKDEHEYSLSKYKKDKEYWRYNDKSLKKKKKVSMAINLSYKDNETDGWNEFVLNDKCSRKPIIH